MAIVYGRDMGKRDIMKYIGDISQIAGAKEYEFTSGRARGVRAIGFRTGSGLDFTVLPGRGMDIAFASYKGQAISYISKTGIVSPAFYEAPNTGFLRNFFAGLLTTCGLSNFGIPCVDQGIEFGQHGRISNIEAEDVGISNEWHRDEFIMSARGKIREAKFFYEYLVLDRKISARLGDKSIMINDVVDNPAFEPQPIMMLYHFNFGYPLLSEDSVVVKSSGTVTGLNEESEKAKVSCCDIHVPVNGYQEQVFVHDMKPDHEGFVYAAIINNVLDLGAYIKFRKDQLPGMLQWKMLGETEYVVGLEPILGMPCGRDKAREAGLLDFIEPGGTRSFDIEIGILDGIGEIEQFKKLIK